MAKKTAPKTATGALTTIAPALINTVCRRLGRNLRVRRTLPGKGRLHIDRQLPFLCVYRYPPDREDLGTARLVKGEASYLIAPGDSKLRGSVSELVHRVVDTLSAEFGAFLIIEIWAAPDGGQANDLAVPTVLPTFTIHAPTATPLARTIETLERRLRNVRILKQGVDVVVVRDERGYPPDLRPLLPKQVASQLHCATIGIAVPPVYRKPGSTALFPLITRALRHGISLALRQTWFEFARSRTVHRPAHYHALGRRAVVKAVWEIDRKLAVVSNQFDYLLQLTPVNAGAERKRFLRDRGEREPQFHYRPLPVDPDLLKRELYRIPIERVEDPALQQLFEGKRDELELKLTMLRDRDTDRFLYESLQLFGPVRDDLLQLAHDLLQRLPARADRQKGVSLDATAFAACAEREFDYYRQLCPNFTARTVVSSEVSGLLVSRGKLLINADLQISPDRAEALLAHEVGTHLVTYYNGREQPFQQLYSGLAGYEELQEGLAVLAEYLVGGLSRSRMRQLAGRVVAVRQLTDGATFVDTFRTLDQDWGFTQPMAYQITMRVYRGGGLTKDAVYLRGLKSILRYVKRGGDLSPLLVGKFAIEHIPIIKELQYRNVLQPAAITPRYVVAATAQQRLQALRHSQATVLSLLEGV